jgi:hypothetical protein
MLLLGVERRPRLNPDDDDLPRLREIAL